MYFAGLIFQKFHYFVCSNNVTFLFRTENNVLSILCVPACLRAWCGDTWTFYDTRSLEILSSLNLMRGILLSLFKPKFLFLISCYDIFLNYQHHITQHLFIAMNNCFHLFFLNITQPQHHKNPAAFKFDSILFVLLFEKNLSWWLRVDFGCGCCRDCNVIMCMISADRITHEFWCM